jgi:hypothetical protein
MPEKLLEQIVDCARVPNIAEGRELIYGNGPN